MQKVYDLSTRIKIISDLLILALIISFIQNSLIDDAASFFSSTKLVIVFVSLVAWFYPARAMGLYEDFRDRPFSQEWIAFLKTLALYSLVISFIFFQFLNKYPYSRSHIVFHCSLIFILLPVQKLLIRLALKKIRRSEYAMRKVLIVGAGEAGMNFYKRYVKNRRYRYTLAGFVDDEVNTSLNGHYLGKTEDIDKVIANHELDDIFVTLPITSEAQLEKIVTVSEREGKKVRIIPHFERFGSGRLQVDTLGSLQIINLRPLPLDITDNKIYKRIFDIIFSLLLIVLLFSWLFPIIAVLIKLGSKGPVFFKQERWGLNNKPIVCYKFRSMVATSKDVDGQGNYQQARKGDPRITKIGRFLRKSNLDELPQFFNVLFGSMSVVGPRPHPVPLNMMSKDSIENYMLRHWVKPGITGWAQVNGYRGETRDSYLMQKRVESDVWYIENWTFWLDWQIILQTLVNMVKGEKNAF